MNNATITLMRTRPPRRLWSFSWRSGPPGGGTIVAVVWTRGYDWLRRVFATALVACATACSGALDLDLDTRTRPCTGPAGTSDSVRWFTPAADRPASAPRCMVRDGRHAGRASTAATPSHCLPGRRIALVSWNVHVGGGDIAALSADLRSGRLTGGEALPVVLLLQEAFRTSDDIPPWRSGQPAPPRIAPPPPSGPRVSTPDLARRLGLHLVYVPSMRNGPGDANQREDRGSAILSTMTLADPHAIELPFERQRRVAVAARIADVTPDDDLWVVNVHLENRTGSRHFWLEAPSARARQARALVKKFLPDGPAILGGDLNTWASNEPTIELLKDVFDTPVERSRDTLRASGASTTCWPVCPRAGRCDGSTAVRLGSLPCSESSRCRSRAPTALATPEGRCRHRARQRCPM